MPKNRVRSGLPAQSHLSQNFLVDRRAIERLVAAAEIAPGDAVVEIGAGRGYITQALLERGARVTAVEIDPALCRRLEDKLGGEPGFRLVRGDFLSHPLPTKPYKVCANIPFAITSRIVERLAQRPPQSAALLVEWGAAKRLSGSPRDTAASLAIKPSFDARIAGKVDRSLFRPCPSVDGAILHLALKTPPDLPFGELGRYHTFINRCLKNGIRSVFTHKQLSVALKRAQISPETAMGDIAYIQWLCLFRCSLHFTSNA